MNYEKIYNDLISKRQINPIDTSKYHEIHHIIPKSLNGSDDKSNLIALTAKEHFIAHRLLERIMKEKFGKNSIEHGKMLTAIFFMSNLNKYKCKITSRKYAKLRNDISEYLSIKNSGDGNPMFGKNYQSYAIVKYSKDRTGKTDVELYGEERAKEISYKKGSFRGKHFSEEHKSKISNAHKGINTFEKMTDEQKQEFREKISKAQKGRKKSEEHKLKIGLGNKGKKRTVEIKKHLSEINKGKKLTQETKNKISAKHKGRKFTKEHCEKIAKNNCMHNHSVMDYMTEEEIKLWKQHISESSKGRKRMIHPITKDKKFVKESEVQKYLDLGYIFGCKV